MAVIVAVPETRVQVPVPAVTVLPESVAVVAQAAKVWLDPAEIVFTGHVNVIIIAPFLPEPPT